MAASRANAARIALDSAFEPSTMNRRAAAGSSSHSTRLSISARMVAAANREQASAERPRAASSDPDRLMRQGGAQEIIEANQRRENESALERMRDHRAQIE